MKKTIRQTAIAAVVAATLSLGLTVAPTIAYATDTSHAADQATQNAAFKEFEPKFEALIKEGRAFYWGGKKQEGATHMYAFIEPNCSACHGFYQAMKQQESGFKKYKVQVILVPVAFLKPSSPGRAAALIKGGWDAYVKNEEGYHAPEEGGIEPLPTVAANKVEFYAVRDNLNLIEQYYTKLKLPSVGTPAILFLDNKGSADNMAGITPTLLKIALIAASRDPSAPKWNGSFGQ